MRRSALLMILVVSLGASVATADTAQDVVTLSVVGTTDLHGYVFPRDDEGGLALLGGYMRNLRAAPPRMAARCSSSMRATRFRAASSRT